MQLRILELNKEQVNTKYGQKDKWKVTAENENGDKKFFDSFIGRWNSDWKVDDIIDFQDDQLKSREYNGKVYWSLFAPPEARGGNLFTKLEEIDKKLDQLDAKIDKVIKLLEKKEEIVETPINEIPF